MTKTKLIITPHPDFWVKLFIPKHWKYLIANIASFESNKDLQSDKYDIYYLSDKGYDSVSKIINNPSDGSCFELSQLCNDKFNCRKNMKSLQDIPFKLCSSSLIEWPKPDEKLVAKPVNGTGSSNINIVKHGDKIYNPENDLFIVEKYIDDKYPRISVDGYICGDNIDILAIWDNNYCEDIPTNLKSLTFPSIHSNNPNILKKYRTVVKELAQKTNCNNQIIDIEFFILSEDDIRVIEINPRCGGNYLPIYHVTGYMPLYVSEQLKNNIIPSKTEKMGKAYVRYNYEFSSKNSVQKGVYSNNIFRFTVNSHSYAHSYAYTYDDNVSIGCLELAAQYDAYLFYKDY